MIGCGEIHERECGGIWPNAHPLRGCGETLTGSSPVIRIDCFENLVDPENNIKFDDK